MPMMLFARERGFMVDGAIVLNGIAVVAKAAEAALGLFRITGVAASRAAAYRLSPAAAIEEFSQRSW
jgi:hypothetical protein